MASIWGLMLVIKTAVGQEFRIIRVFMEMVNGQDHQIESVHYFILKGNG